MEVYFVYGLVVIFFLALPLIVIVLMQNPIAEADPSQQTQETQQSQGLPPVTRLSSSSGKIAYGILAALFAFICVITVLINRNHPQKA